MGGLLQGYSLCAVITQRLHQTCILCFALHRIKVVLEILYVGLQQCYYFPNFRFCSQDLQKFLIPFLFFYQPPRNYLYSHIYPCDSEVKEHPKARILQTQRTNYEDDLSLLLTSCSVKHST